jgi:hypothetical protein
LLLKPPPNDSSVSLIHKISEFYKNIYLLGPKLPKKDKFGIFLKIENLCLELYQLFITATFEVKDNKLPYLKNARIKIEMLKRLLRLTYELNIIKDKQYINLESSLQEMSKMTNGWIKYLN